MRVSVSVSTVCSRERISEPGFVLDFTFSSIIISPLRGFRQLLPT
ncbi:hypothetical protein SAMN05216402_0827 [Nitrosospira multiformis]|uniref:Uncharacterized protein n=1 Tax=Nitrosospira multiformis TaxID=1231 RepID=A0ABY0TDF4_9PROT|nr:hypothetical protein SAMN05216402_0827 [Nitrosospira multiformis]